MDTACRCEAPAHRSPCHERVKITVASHVTSDATNDGTTDAIRPPQDITTRFSFRSSTCPDSSKRSPTLSPPSGRATTDTRVDASRTHPHDGGTSANQLSVQTLIFLTRDKTTTSILMSNTPRLAILDRRNLEWSLNVVVPKEHEHLHVQRLGNVIVIPLPHVST